MVTRRELDELNLIDRAHLHFDGVSHDHGDIPDRKRATSDIVYLRKEIDKYPHAMTSLRSKLQEFFRNNNIEMSTENLNKLGLVTLIEFNQLHPPEGHQVYVAVNKTFCTKAIRDSFIALITGWLKDNANGPRMNITYGLSQLLTFNLIGDAAEGMVAGAGLRECVPFHCPECNPDD